MGAFYYHPNWYLGFSVHDLLSNSDTRKDFVYNQNSIEGLVFRPRLLIKEDFFGSSTLDVNALLIFDEKFWVGAAFVSRSGIFDRDYYDLSLSNITSYNSIGLLAQLYTNSKLRIGFFRYVNESFSNA